MNNLFYANLFFITATAVMFMTVFVSTMLLVHVMKLLGMFHEILESAKRTTEKVETVSGNFLEKIEHQSENVSGVLNSIFGFLGVKTKTKKITTKRASVKKVAKKTKKSE